MNETVKNFEYHTIHKYIHTYVHTFNLINKLVTIDFIWISSSYYVSMQPPKAMTTTKFKNIDSSVLKRFGRL